MWPASIDSDGDVVDVMPVDCLAIPVGSRFQLRAHMKAGESPPLADG